MLGIRFMKAVPTAYVLHYSNGTVKRSGAGLSFFYAKTSIAMAFQDLAANAEKLGEVNITPDLLKSLLE